MLKNYLDLFPDNFEDTWKDSQTLQDEKSQYFLKKTFTKNNQNIFKKLSIMKTKIS